jgi:hypothetical protein
MSVIQRSTMTFFYVLRVVRNSRVGHFKDSRSYVALPFTLSTLSNDSSATRLILSFS